MYAIFGGTSTRAYTPTHARGATPELRRVADTTPHGLSAGRHSTQDHRRQPQSVRPTKGGVARQFGLERNDGV